MERELRHLREQQLARERKAGAASLFGPLKNEDWTAWKQEAIERLCQHFGAEAEAADLAAAFFGEAASKGVTLVDLLARRYDLVAANPPYMGSKNMGPVLKKYVERHFVAGKRDLYAAFIFRARPPHRGGPPGLRQGAAHTAVFGLHRSGGVSRSPPHLRRSRARGEDRGPRRDTQIDDATAFVERFMLKPARKPAGREDYPQYEVGAVHEAIVNAVAHRDYSIAGSKIRLFLFADRLEFYSPGALPNTLTVDTMPYRVFTRNQLLVSFLAKMKSRRTGRAFLESRGEGVRRILEESERHSGRRPVYELFGDELRLTIWAKSSPHGEADGSAELPRP